VFVGQSQESLDVCGELLALTHNIICGIDVSTRVLSMHFCYFRIVYIAQHGLPEGDKVVQDTVVFRVRRAHAQAAQQVETPGLSNLVTQSPEFVAMLQ
jgi:hypothetical protein